MTTSNRGDSTPQRTHNESARTAERFIEQLGRLPAAHATFFAVMLAALVLVLDLVTGSEVAFSIFYVLPVSIIALRFGSVAGSTAAVVAAVSWFTTETFSDDDAATFVPLWNGVVRLGFFALTSVLVVAVRDLLQERREEARLDALTGVANNRGFRELAERELARAHRSAGPLSIAYIDLDRFKQLNDSAGHSAGDAALSRLGAAMRVTVRTVDVVGRLGGDEFALLLPETAQTDATVLVERLRTALEPICTEFEIDTSIGVVTFTTPPASVDEALQQADGLMYEVKAAGKGDVRYAVWPALRSEIVGSDEAAVDVQE